MIQSGSLKERVYEIIFEAETPLGKAFDVILLWAIGFSVTVVMLESVHGIEMRYGQWLRFAEWFFTIIFTLEYLVRLWCVPNAWRYARSFFGIVDILSFLPTYLTLILSGSHYLVVVRILRLLRIFRILKMARHMGEAHVFLSALRNSRAKITVFLFTVMSLALIFGTLLYLFEGEHHGFSSIPKSLYWAIVTMTTVGYGDIVPLTIPGQFIASLMMIMGYAIIAVPTGIIGVDIYQEMMRNLPSTRTCHTCGSEGHEAKSKYCKDCGAIL